jgi:hypothetical protein
VYRTGKYGRKEKMLSFRRLKSLQSADFFFSVWRHKIGLTLFRNADAGVFCTPIYKKSTLDFMII